VKRLVDGQRHPDVEVRLKKMKLRRQHAHHGERRGVYEQRPAEDGAVRAEPPFPEAVGQQHHPMLSRLLFPGVEGSTQCDVYVEHGKERGGDADAADRFGRRPARPRLGEGEVPVAPGGEAIERAALSTPVEEIAGRRIDVEGNLPAIAFVEPDQPIDVRDRGRTEKQRVDHAEDRRVRADAQREREHGDERKRRLAPQIPPGVRRVPGGAFQPHDSPSSARRVICMQSGPFGPPCVA
jgi:hypothetical protein